MNLFDCVTCNQYYELQKNGRDETKAMLNGNLLNSVCIVLMSFCNLIFMNHVIEQNYSEKLSSIFGERSGKDLGELIGLIAIAIIYSFIKKTIGSQARFQRITAGFDT